MRKYIKEISKDTDDKEEEVKSAINHAIQDCIDQNILKAFFEKNRGEVIFQIKKTRESLENLGLNSDTIDELFAQVNAESATLVP